MQVRGLSNHGFRGDKVNSKYMKSHFVLLGAEVVKWMYVLHLCVHIDLCRRCRCVSVCVNRICACVCGFQCIKMYCTILHAHPHTDINKLGGDAGETE